MKLDKLVSKYGSYAFCCLLLCLLSPCVLVAIADDVIDNDAILEKITDENSDDGSVALGLGKNLNVRIKLSELEPSLLEVEPGTTVIWINDLDVPVRVKFISELVSTTCKAPRGFIIGRKGIYESKKIKGGAVASLCFLERGDYEYQIELTGERDIEEVDLDSKHWQGAISVTH